MKHIKLTQGQHTLVDDEDYDYLMQWKWNAQWNPCTKSYYVVRTEGKWPNRHTVRMHRVICERKIKRNLEKSEEVDHIHGETLDNRRTQLVPKTKQGNQANQTKYSNNTSGYKGVTYKLTRRKYKYWNAQIRYNTKTISLGCFPYTDESKIEAAKMYDRAYLYFFREMATDRGMNFPELKKQYLIDLKNNPYTWIR